MKIDTGLGVVIVAVLIFYLRLIILQRQRAKQVRRTVETGSSKKRKAKQLPPTPPNYSVVSRKRRDWIIAGIGGVLILFGALAYANVLAIPVLRENWWIPTAIGIVAFSWLFGL